MLRKILPCEVEAGMFIVGFGGSWFNHPFWRRRIRVESHADVERIRTCNVPWVEIDTSRGSAPAHALDASQTPEGLAVPEAPEQPRQPDYGAMAANPPRRLVYKPAFADPAHRSARATVSRAGVRIRGVFENVELGWRVEPGVIDEVLGDIEREVAANIEALLSVVSLKSKDDYTYLHSVAVCALMVCVARHKGLEPDEVHELGMAGLLHDIGKIRVADEILKKPGRLTDEEYTSVRDHTRFGFDLLKDVPDIPERALDVCLHHHEKIDGTGYPVGLEGDKISYAARLGAVCDVFDALTSNRAYKEPWSRQRALEAMWSWEGHFDRSIIADLMQILHVYPEGVLVRLANGHLAITVGNPTRPPEGSVLVIEFYSALNNRWIAPIAATIARSDPERAITSVEDPACWGFEDWDRVCTQVQDALNSGTAPFPVRPSAITA